MSVKNVEHLFVVIYSGYCHLIVDCAYFPPGTNVEIYKAHFCAIEEVIRTLPNSQLLITGDFNFPNTY